ncbi:30S ribosomal protein S3 [Methermicoccus shengliensis]|uniref:Small ribosomal subunit protein uS3 n=1 Tax=Methermicoccus shengliensis TaxID=660064 RepID=A0A832VX23_9EURY|nr:30S ribosomal protein S3 [Methermicoccus shengliensis]KUK05112.1 MAG: 30S ribosomal protein S3 [Euryarchaeota archaeon 55_53]KUK30678.1 MAG: 30S ribosomal protein S3 [Methanosarcinales archeaon 56_1174]MDI3488428.1 small subunit ribosomal protein [Methanosarcinales archaeon]MDN5294653.1 small subunit ribosomal protein [Methanosarcinales archaeon]HIH69363.1 30S ribosomal protein S3 [Methermicoccus shengliensis]
MAVESRFVREGLTKARLNEFLSRRLERAGYGGMVVKRTPMGTHITVYSEKPGMIIGKGGRTIKQLTAELETRFDMDNPQIEVQEVKVPELNAQMMATRLASTLERGWYFRKAGHTLLQRIMEAGALGCEIVISGKLTGPRSRTEKFVAGYIKHAGEPAEDLVQEGFSIAVKKLGVIGCRVRIIPPDVELPDDFRIVEPAAEASEQEEEPSRPTETEKPTLVEELEASEEGEAGAEQAPAESEDEMPAEPSEPKIELPEPTLPGEEIRERDGRIEHKHEGYEYWHPYERVHKKAGEQ